MSCLHCRVVSRGRFCVLAGCLASAPGAEPNSCRPGHCRCPWGARWPACSGSRAYRVIRISSRINACSVSHRLVAAGGSARAAGAVHQSLRVAGAHRAGHRQRHRAPARGAHRGTRHLPRPGALLPATRRGWLLRCRSFQRLESSGVLSNYQPLRLETGRFVRGEAKRQHRAHFRVVRVELRGIRRSHVHDAVSKTADVLILRRKTLPERA